MSQIILPNNSSLAPNSVVEKGGIAAQLQSKGRLPPVSLVLTPLENSRPQVVLNSFLSYEFNSSILTPVDTFSFSFAAPADPTPFNQVVKEGDIVTLYANGIALATGLVDTTDVEVDNEFGEKITVQGRDLMGQLEDQDTVTLQSTPIWANNYTINQAMQKLIVGTRIRSISTTGDAPVNPYLFSADPGESKLAALQRFLEGLNCLAWMDPTGNIVVGRPNMNQASSGNLSLSKAQRSSNVLSMKCSRQAALIPNVVIPIWTGQESVVQRVAPEQGIANKAPGPSRLFQNGHWLSKAVVVSTPQATSPGELNNINKIAIGAGSVLQLYGLRELARQNQREVIVQALVPGHYNDSAQPFKVDTLYQVDFDRGDISEQMYLFQVQYSLSMDGQRTSLWLCRKGTIVAEVKAT